MALTGTCMFCPAYWMFACISATRKRCTRRLRVGGHPWRHRWGLLCLGNVGHAQDCGQRHTTSGAITPSVVFPRSVSCKTSLDCARRVSWVLDTINSVAVFGWQVTIRACSAGTNLVVDMAYELGLFKYWAEHEAVQVSDWYWRQTWSITDEAWCRLRESGESK